MKPQYMNETRGCVMDLENVIETLKAMDSTIRAKQLEIEYLSQQNLELQRRSSRRRRRLLMRYQHEGTYGEVTTLPGCSQVAVSHSVFRPSCSRGSGRDTEGMLERLRMMFEDLGYDYVLCTVDASNARQIHMLEKNGWRRLDWFKSSKTEHTVELWGTNNYTGTDHPITPPAPSDAMTESERVTYDAWEKSISRPLPVDVNYYNWFNGAE